MRRLELAERVIELRERAELTQGEAAKRAGVGVTTWSNIETGTITRPHARTVIKMARALGVNPEDLTAPKGAGPLSPEWAITAQDEQFRRTIESTPTERLGSLVLDLVSGYQPQSLEDLAKASPEEVHRRVVSFSRAGIIREELERRGERPPERYVLALKRFQDAMTGGEEVVRDRNQQSRREAG